MFWLRTALAVEIVNPVCCDGSGRDDSDDGDQQI